jgi:hypothetical protein
MEHIDVEEVRREDGQGQRNEQIAKQCDSADHLQSKEDVAVGSRKHHAHLFLGDCGFERSAVAKAKEAVQSVHQKQQSQKDPGDIRGYTHGNSFQGERS